MLEFLLCCQVAIGIGTHQSGFAFFGKDVAEVEISASAWFLQPSLLLSWRTPDYGAPVIMPQLVTKVTRGRMSAVGGVGLHSRPTDAYESWNPHVLAALETALGPGFRTSLTTMWKPYAKWTKEVVMKLEVVLG